MRPVVECVPNYSEGRDSSVIMRIADAAASVAGVKVLHIDTGAAANRTVITFAGPPEEVCEAAFRASATAQELIDMRLHHGEHPRQGATDVLPLIPVSGITLEECAAMARELAARMAGELGIPCYCYEAAALKPERANLAVCRSGEYESLPRKMADMALRPDFGPDSYNETVARSGATCVGARNFLIAVNFNLNTTDTAIANEIARDVRQKGRKTIVDGRPVWVPGTLKGCKAIGWYIEEYGIAQVSMNITDIDATPLHVAFEEVSRAAAARGVKVTGTEIIGLVPKRVLLEAGLHYQGSQDSDEDELIDIAIRRMVLDDLRPFDPKAKVLENLL